MKPIVVRHHAVTRARQRWNLTGTDEEIADQLTSILEQATQVTTSRGALEYETGNKRLRCANAKDRLEIITVYVRGEYS